MSDLITSLEQAGEGSRELVRGLTKVQRRFVMDGCIHGDFSITTVRCLMRKGLFHIVTDSPNGQFGPMRLTERGLAVPSALKATNPLTAVLAMKERRDGLVNRLR